MTDILRDALKRYQQGIDSDRDNRDRDLDDRVFYRGLQWDEADRERRKNRPTLTINRLPQFVKQVTGEMRQNKPAIRVLPVDDQTDPDLAEVYTAIIRHIESRSDAHRVYSKSGEQATIGGIGWFRILTDYADDKSFDQEIFIRHIRDPLSVVMDPDAQDLTCEDANWAFVIEDMTLAGFGEKYPDARTDGFPTDDESYSDWRSDDTIRVAEYWVREPVQRELILLNEGSTRYGDEIDDALAEQMDDMGLEVIATRPVTDYKVKCHKITAVETLESFDWEGSTIPVIPCKGEEIELSGTVFRHGLIYHARDGQRSYNFARSAMTEHIASQPKAPYLATTAMVQNHKKAWQDLNTGNPPVLLYDVDPQAPGGRPQREAPPTFASAWYQEAMIADGDMKATTGIYDASLGQKSNETSGVAIRARDQQGETASFVYMDNLEAAIKRCGKILLEIIPKIYTGERVVRLMGEDDAIEGYNRVNTMLPDGTVFNDISAGQFDLSVTTGPAFATKRQEASERMTALLQAVPAIGNAAPDLLVKSFDMPYGEKLADRLALIMVPPGIDPEIDRKRMEAQQAMAEQQGPQQPDPAQQMAQQAQMLQMAELQAKIEKLKAEAAKIGAQVDETQSDTMLNMAKAQQTQVQTGLEDDRVRLDAMRAGFDMAG